MTLAEALEVEGMCTACKEHTQVIESCCGALVYVEGSTMSADSLLDKLNDDDYAKAKEMELV